MNKYLNSIIDSLDFRVIRGMDWFNYFMDIAFYIILQILYIWTTKGFGLW